MTKENLLRYLRDPSYLHQISYQELKTLVAEHPNSLSLRYLLALKSKQENNGDYQRQLEFLATYSIDRPYLYDTYNKEEQLEQLPDEVMLEEDFLELKELSALERELSATHIAGTGVAATIGASALAFEIDTPSPTQPTASTEIPIEQNISISEDIELTASENVDYYTLDFGKEVEQSSTSSLEITDEKVADNLAEIEDLFKDLDGKESVQNGMPAIETAALPTPEPLDVQETIEGGEFPEIPLVVMDTAVDVLEEGELPIAQEPTNGRAASDIDIVPIIIEEESLVVHPVPKKSFSTWYKDKKQGPDFVGYDLVGFNSKSLIDEVVKQKKPRPAQLDEIEKVLTAANKSLVIESDIASETLAKLLIDQGNYQKAIAMYQQLSLIFPEKSSLFAAEIRRIENHIDGNSYG